MAAVIETHNLTKRYGGARGIERVSLTVEAGEVLGDRVSPAAGCRVLGRGGGAGRRGGSGAREGVSRDAEAWRPRSDPEC